MQNYTVAWTVVVLMAAGGGLALWLLLRSWPSLSLRLGIVVAVVCFFVTPTAVPRFEGTWAPAFVVAIFESFFQIEGEPVVAVLSLLAGIFLGVTIAITVRRAFKQQTQ